MTGKEKGMDLRKRWLAILTTMCMLASLAPTGVFAASSGSAAGMSDIPAAFLVISKK